ncbi:hypothetical protein ACFUTU_03970 [Arthrobacter sp. NPDC057388]|uniref:hypothetical protein n=1 Tax=Arthrobacter sp. NPDC057388 TaxID=3346116 RepID=UPI00363A810C
MKTRRGAGGLLPGLLAMVVLSGCAPEGTASTGAAEAFHRAVSGSDMTAACALLQPHTREETARSSDDGSCESQLQKAKLTDPGKVLRTEQYGQDAFVQFENDAVFLAVSGGGWKVTAAGCRPNGEEAPYTCEVGGN